MASPFEVIQTRSSYSDSGIVPSFCAASNSSVRTSSQQRTWLQDGFVFAAAMTTANLLEPAKHPTPDPQDPLRSATSAGDLGDCNHDAETKAHLPHAAEAAQDGARLDHSHNGSLGSVRFPLGMDATLPVSRRESEAGCLRHSDVEQASPTAPHATRSSDHATRHAHDDEKPE